MIFLLRTGDLFHDRYKLIQKLGVGGFSEVWLAEDTISGNMQVALKVFALGTGLDTQGLSTFSSEYALVFNFNHPHLLKPMHFAVWNDRPYLVMQYMANGSSLKLCGKATEKEVAAFIVQIGSALAYLHNNEPPVLHQDIKPDNVLIDSRGNFLLTDFGISTQMRRTLTRSAGKAADNSGTLPYMGPERFGKHPNPTRESDIWALGATLYELLTGNLPFGEHGGMVQKGGAEIPDMSTYCTAPLAAIIEACLHANPTQRPTAAQLVQAAKKYEETGKWDLQGLSNYTGPERSRRPAPKPPKEIAIRPATIITILALIVLAVVLGIWQPWKSSGPSSEELIAMEQARLDSIAQAETEKATQDSIVTSKTPPTTPATTITNNITNITHNSVTASGNVTSDGGGRISERGVVYSTSPNPSTAHNKVSAGSGKGNFTAKLTGLNENTTYYVRAYAINEAGTAYGDERVIRTVASVAEVLEATVNGTFTDSRNGKTYKTVKIGTQTWMAENLNYSTGNSWCYDNNTSNCTKFGRLYDWNTARSACPSGWHLPSDAEWSTLTNFVGSDAGKKLKSTTGWNSSGNGTDAYGFTALPGGCRYSGDTFDLVGDHGNWWSSTENDTTNAYYRNMYYYGSSVYRDSNSKDYGFSVRCIRDF